MDTNVRSPILKHKTLFLRSHLKSDFRKLFRHQKLHVLLKVISKAAVVIQKFFFLLNCLELYIIGAFANATKKVVEDKAFVPGVLCYFRSQNSAQFQGLMQQLQSFWGRNYTINPNKQYSPQLQVGVNSRISIWWVNKFL